jgi:hypothetical protein
MTELEALEKVWIAEVSNQLPFQSRAAIYKRLEAHNLVERMEVTLPGRLPVVVNGWQLTHAGRLYYCSSCKDEDAET